MSVAACRRLVASAPRNVCRVAVGARTFSVSFTDKEKAAEKQYFNAEDEKLLRVSATGSGRSQRVNPVAADCSVPARAGMGRTQTTHPSAATSRVRPSKQLPIT
jgi:hypothetical protein